MQTERSLGDFTTAADNDVKVPTFIAEALRKKWDKHNWRILIVLGRISTGNLHSDNI
jgi:hypothetical protein